MVVNFPQACGPRSQTGLRFCLTLRENCMVVNFPQACGPRSQTGLRFYLTLSWKLHSSVAPRITSFINNSTFSGYLHSKGEALHVHPNLPKNRPLCRLWRWYDMGLPNLVRVFPMQNFLQCPGPSSIPDPREPGALASPWHRNPTWAFTDSTQVGPFCCLFFPRWGLSSFPEVRC